MTVGELLERISSRELSEWMVFYTLEPFGSQADYLGHAITASTIANLMRDPRKQKAMKPEDFMPKFDEAIKERKEKSPEEMWLNFKTWALLAGAKKLGNSS